MNDQLQAEVKDHEESEHKYNMQVKINKKNVKENFPFVYLIFLSMKLIIGEHIEERAGRYGGEKQKAVN